ncbi:MAG TPA: glycosyltransferase family 87 protein [Candidatus Baltobacteraceae bacterium]
MRSKTRREFAATVAVCALVVFAFFGARPLFDSALHRHGGDPYPATDFAIFYCAGAALDAGRNPYLLEPLRSCEHRIWTPGYLPASAAEPAALPGYAVLPFALLAKLPFPAAKFLWLVLSCVFFGVAVACGQRLSRMPAVAVFAILFVPVAMLNIRWGQLGPLVAAALFASAVLARAGRERLAAVAAIAATIEPHIGLPVLVALSWFAPRSRAVVIGGAAVLAVAHFWSLGLATGLRYFTQVLPAMSHAELLAADQYGTVWALHAGGLSERYATLLAQPLYVAAIVCSLLVVAAYLRRFADRSAIVAAPAAVALLGAPYLHDVELCVALILPLAALARTSRRMAWSAIAVALAIPWYAATHDTVIATAAIGSGALFLAIAASPRGRLAITAALACTLAGLVAILALRHLPVGHSAAVAFGNPGVLAAESWGAYLRSQPPALATGMQTAVPKALTWVALLLAALGAAQLSKRSTDEPTHVEGTRRVLRRTG